MFQIAQLRSYKWTTAEFILAIIFLLAPFYYHNNIGGTGLNIPSNITVWAAVTSFVWFAVNRVLQKSEIILLRKAILVLAFPILATVSGFISGISAPIEWVFRLLFIWGGALFLVGLFQFNFSRAQKDKLLFILLIAGLCHGLVASVQYLQPDGVTIFLPTVKEKNLATGIFQQINVHASFQATIVLIACYLINRPLAKFSQRVRWVILITTFLSTYIVLSSGSRVGFLSLAVGMVLLVFICWPVVKRNKKNCLILVFVIAFALLASFFSDGFIRLKDKSTVVHTEYQARERGGIYLISAESVKQAPIVGHGLGSFDSVWQYQKADFQRRHPNHELVEAYVTHPHNELLFWQVEGGLIATLGILLSFITILVLAWCSRARYAIALLFPFALHNQVELPFHISATAWFACVFLIYIAVSHAGKIRVNNFISKPMSRVLRPLNYSSLVIAMLFYGHTVWANYLLEQSTKPSGTVNLDLPLQNPYFTTIAEDFRMQQIFHLSFTGNNAEMMRAFNRWQEETISFHPTAFNFEMLIASYLKLQKKEQACASAQQAWLMYKQNLEFQRYVERCQRLTK